MRSGARVRQTQAGFTVVELLVALTLFSLLCTLLFGNVRFGLKAWQHGLAHAERVDHSMIVQNLLRRIMERSIRHSSLMTPPTRMSTLPGPRTPSRLSGLRRSLQGEGHDTGFCWQRNITKQGPIS